MQAYRQWLLLVLMAAFLLARTTGAHLHLCFDGSEPLAQLHVADSAKLDHHGTGSQDHDDVDVDALGSVLAKAGKIDVPGVALVAWCFVLLLVAVARRPVRRRANEPPRRLPYFFTPLLRAPPA